MIDYIALKDAAIDFNATIGEHAILTNIFPVVEYVDGVATQKVIAYKYIVACTGSQFKKLGVKIPGPKQLELVEGELQEVVFDMLQKYTYKNKAGVECLGATAKSVRVVNKKP